jgi:hypothetical protein
MKTDDLIALLAADGAPVDPHAVSRRFGTGLGLGTVAAVALMLAWLGLRPDMVDAARLPMFWYKLAFPALLGGAALAAAARLSRPGVRVGLVWLALAAPVMALWAISAWLLAQAPPLLRTDMLLGSSSSVCTFNIAVVSVPLFIAAFWAMKGFAPTRLALAGAVAGLLAGAVGALVYALHCTEMEAPFLAVWYVAGMLVPTVFGAVLGPRLLRW